MIESKRVEKQKFQEEVDCFLIIENFVFRQWEVTILRPAVTVWLLVPAFYTVLENQQ